MAKTIIQALIQDNQQGEMGAIAKRLIILFSDTEATDHEQFLIEYDDMTTEAKAIYDTFMQLCDAYITV